MTAVPGSDEDTVVLWRPAGQAELDLVAASGWRAWPARLPEQTIFYPVLDHGYATRITREWNVPAGGAGYVTSFQVRRQFLDRYPQRQVGGDDVREYWIPAEDLAELNANIVGAIVEKADYRASVPDEEFTVAESLGAPLPAAWRGYLQSASWFRRGWLPSGCYLWLYRPQESIELLDAWGEVAAANHPGIAIIGGNGSREHLVLDLRQDPAPVLLVDITSEGWAAAIPQADDVPSFVERVESGQFDFAWDEAE
ncbi:hypothetical protein GCM10022225_05400 [Plantactinospora mayteni]|uniref:SMI1/KNR4 family protein n=1 Tax=Plantactinospora mayteni TaxID=566021 RepID=A0ABQ4EQT4_9ACTN|nr:hypothetical protein [Plantactinospora mayteni]GIG97029.1 hypothetical protein Pma05_36020 [Plantactinospora mayteni]